MADAQRQHQRCREKEFHLNSAVSCLSGGSCAAHYGPRALAASAVTRKVPGKFHDEAAAPVFPRAGSAGERSFEIGRRVRRRSAASPARDQSEFKFTVSERRPRISHQFQIESLALAAMRKGMPRCKRGTRFGLRVSHQLCESVPLSERARVGKAAQYS